MSLKTWTLLLLLAPLIGASQPDRSEIVSTYFEAYHTGKVAHMVELLATDAYFTDRTAQMIGSDLELTGKTEISETLAKMFKAVAAPEWTTAFEFQAGSYGISAGTFQYKATVGAATKVLRYEVVSIIEINDQNLIQRHTEYADYGKALNQMSQ